MSTKISALPPSAGLVLTDIFPVVDDPGGTPVTQKATISQLQTLFSSGAGSFVLKAGDTMTGPLNMTAGQSYQYDGAFVIRAQTAGNNYFFGPSGNLTMTGLQNTSVGSLSFTSNTTGNNNVAIGNQALVSNTTGGGNLAIGSFALFANISGISNVAFGTGALAANTTGGGNTAAGLGSLGDITSGGLNTAIGVNTGLGITTGSNNTIIGAGVTGLAAGLSNNIIIADGAGNRRINVDSAGLVGIATIVQNSTLHVQGSLALAYVAKVATYTATTSDYTIDCTSGTFDVDLPTAVGITGRIYVVKNSGVGTITIDPAGAELIDSLATATVVSGASITTQSTGTGWIII